MRTNDIMLLIYVFAKKNYYYKLACIYISDIYCCFHENKICFGCKILYCLSKFFFAMGFFCETLYTYLNIKTKVNPGIYNITIQFSFKEQKIEKGKVNVNREKKIIAEKQLHIILI